jgi:hypothetical protein
VHICTIMWSNYLPIIKEAEDARCGGVIRGSSRFVGAPVRQSEYPPFSTRADQLGSVIRAGLHHPLAQIRHNGDLAETGKAFVNCMDFLGDCGTPGRT